MERGTRKEGLGKVLVLRRGIGIDSLFPSVLAD